MSIFYLWVSICLSLFLPGKVNRERAPQPSCCSESWQGPGPSMRGIASREVDILHSYLMNCIWLSDPQKFSKIECISIPWHQMRFFFSQYFRHEMCATANGRVKSWSLTFKKDSCTFSASKFVQLAPLSLPNPIASIVSLPTSGWFLW